MEKKKESFVVLALRGMESNENHGKLCIACTEGNGKYENNGKLSSACAKGNRK